MKNWNNVTIADHRIALLCCLGANLTGSTSARTSNFSGAIGASTLCVARRHFSDNMEKTKVLAWEYETPKFSESDLAEYARRILGEGSSNTAIDQICTHRFTLHPQVLCFLNDQKSGGGILLRTTPIAAKRLDPNATEAGTIPITLKNVRIYKFMSGLTLAEVELCIEMRMSISRLPSVGELNETIFGLSHSSERFYSGRLYWEKEFGENESVLERSYTNEKSFTVSSLLQDLTGMKSLDTRHLHCTVIRIDETLTQVEKQELVLRASRRASADYGVLTPQSDHALVEVSSNVIHCISIEGGATLVDGSQKIPFTEQFIAGRWHEIYIPLAIISYHGFRWLQSLCEKESFRIRFDTPSSEQLNLLRQLRNAALQYRLAYRFSSISTLTAHINVHESWRNAFRLPQLEKELSEDFAEIAAYLQSIDTQRIIAASTSRAKAWRPFTVSVSAVATFVLCSELLETLIRTYYESKQLTLLTRALYQPAAIGELENLLHAKHWWEIAALILAGVVAALAASKAWETLHETSHTESGDEESHSMG